MNTRDERPLSVQAIHDVYRMDTKKPDTAGKGKAPSAKAKPARKPATPAATTKADPT